MLPRIEGIAAPHSLWNSVVSEQILGYYDGPRLLLRRSRAGQLYLSWWIDSEEPVDRWVCLAVSQVRLGDVLSGRLTVLEALTDPEDGHLLVVDVDAEENEPLWSVATTLQALPHDSLPSEDYRLDIPMSMLADDHIREGAHQLGVRLLGETRSAPVAAIGKLFSSIQGALDAIGQALVTMAPATQGPVPDSIREQTRLNLVGTYAGSLGLRLETGAVGGPMTGSIAGDSIEWLFKLLESDQQFIYSDECQRVLNSRVAKNYKDLLLAIEMASRDASITWHQHGAAEAARELRVTPDAAKNKRDEIESAESADTETLQLNGVFEAGNIRTGWFKFLDWDTKELLGGRLSRDLMREVDEDSIPLGMLCRVVADSRQSTNRATGETKSRYTFLSIDFSIEEAFDEVEVW